MCHGEICVKDSEIIVDNFAGGGGASTGIELAIGRSVDIAINHDPNAVAMHTTNHPGTLHYCESVYSVRPKVATAGRSVGLAWFSPDCRHFSKAKGAKPVEKAIRGLAWIVIRWALDVGPRVMMLENVEEFKTWGPLLAAEMRPDPERVGETFRAFVGMLTTGIPVNHPALAECCEFLELSPDSDQAKRLIAGLGYDVDYRELRACDYGAPTIRKRFFMVMRRDGQPIVWPAATHGDPKSPAVISGKLAPWRTAAECIDWSIPAPSIFGRKKPLAENTLRRIARGIQRFVIESASPFIVKCNHTTTRGKYDCFRGQALDDPLQTITKTHGYAIAVPHLTKFRTGATGQPVTDPVPTVTAGTSRRPGGNGHALGIVEAGLVPFLAGNGGSEYQAKPRPLDKPAHTILKESRACVVTPVIARQFGASVGHRADEPSATITAGGGGKSQLVSAFLAKHYGGNY
ncbi:DNA cytosine methyltransferase, partial [Klebsiella pneumoniae]|nr:DNA cytosine methyltransferase [Klebsiella pneumoniae]